MRKENTNDESLKGKDTSRIGKTSENPNEAKWDADKGRYTESGPGVADDRQTIDRDRKYDAGTFDERDSKPRNGESLTRDE